MTYDSLIARATPTREERMRAAEKRPAPPPRPTEELKPEMADQAE